MGGRRGDRSGVGPRIHRSAALTFHPVARDAFGRRAAWTGGATMTGERRETPERGGAELDRSLVFYDRDCGFCRWSLARVLAWDRRRRLRPIALQDPHARSLLGDMDRERMFASAHLVTPDGAIHSGGDAVAPILRLLPGGAPLAPMAAAMSGPARVGYNWVARNRRLLGRPLPEWARASATARIDRHV